MAVSGADRRNHADGRDVSAATPSGPGRSNQGCSARVAGIETSALSRGPRSDSAAIADDTGNRGVQVPGESVETGDSAVSGPPAIEVATESVVVLTLPRWDPGVGLPADDFDGINIYLHHGTANASALERAVIVE
jgi:hypothetical protein